MESNRIPTESYRESNQATVVLSVTIKPKQSTTKAGRNKRRPSHAPIVADALEPLGFKNGPPRLRSPQTPTKTPRMLLSVVKPPAIKHL